MSYVYVSVAKGGYVVEGAEGPEIAPEGELEEKIEEMAGEGLLLEEEEEEAEEEAVHTCPECGAEFGEDL